MGVPAALPSPQVAAALTAVAMERAMSTILVGTGPRRLRGCPLTLGAPRHVLLSLRRAPALALRMVRLRSMNRLAADERWLLRVSAGTRGMIGLIRPECLFLFPAKSLRRLPVTCVNRTPGGGRPLLAGCMRLWSTRCSSALPGHLRAGSTPPRGLHGALRWLTRRAVT